MYKLLWYKMETEKPGVNLCGTMEQLALRVLIHCSDIKLMVYIQCLLFGSIRLSGKYLC